MTTLTQRNGFIRSISIRAAYNRISEGYGVHGCDMVFTLTKDNKGVDFILSTNFHLPSTLAFWQTKGDNYTGGPPLPAFVGYHDSKPHYEGQSCNDKCNITGEQCYSEGSGLLAEDLYQIMLTKGDEGVWDKLEELYYDWLLEEQS